MKTQEHRTSHFPLIHLSLAVIVHNVAHKTSSLSLRVPAWNRVCRCLIFSHSLSRGLNGVKPRRNWFAPVALYEHVSPITQQRWVPTNRTVLINTTELSGICAIGESRELHWICLLVPLIRETQGAWYHTRVTGVQFLQSNVPSPESSVAVVACICLPNFCSHWYLSYAMNSPGQNHSSLCCACGIKGLKYWEGYLPYRKSSLGKLNSLWLLMGVGGRCFLSLRWSGS